jgi:hypothetical protein
MSNVNESEDLHAKSLASATRVAEDEARDLATAINLSLAAQNLPPTSNDKDEKKINLPRLGLTPVGMPVIPGLIGSSSVPFKGISLTYAPVKKGEEKKKLVFPSLPVGAATEVPPYIEGDPNWESSEAGSADVDPNHAFLVECIDALMDKYMTRLEIFVTKLMDRHFPVTAHTQRLPEPHEP